MEPDRTVLSRDSTPIAYQQTGEGPAVILVSGALCKGQTDDAPLARQFAALGFAAFTYDRRGRGGSGDTPPYSVDREIDDMAALIDAAGGALRCTATPPVPRWPSRRRPQGCR